MLQPKSEILRQMLGRPLQITIVDGRIFTGTFVCIDQGCHIVLERALEVHPEGHPARDVGLIMISPDHLVHIKARAQDLKFAQAEITPSLPSDDIENA
ncbi:hypothetical protein CROQUDRAFT_670683 [Cronartium quercuum f. sp. fusiforme G11]|uniref:Sm domain-containing protein n=1 Tax=Cronartium quercuum f. sp. fusiforme G11 TaxID=708437 RepID=A0A9P6NK87_9BASI|nr:hypothetical protein CROQUDRAFT_670683 [Cronartium quercuum f. sp. fusiforme G11]